MASQIQKLLTEFLEYLEIEKNRSRLTVRNYDFYLKRFLGFSKINQPAEISRKLIEKYCRYLNQLNVRSKHLNPATINYHLIALRSFLKYLKQIGQKKILPIKEIKLAKINRKISCLTSKEAARILEAPFKTQCLPIIKLRDKAILELLFCAGLKVSAAADLKIKSVDFAKNKVISNEQEHYLSNQAKYWLKKYLDSRSDQSVWLFISHDRASKQRAKREEQRAKNNVPSLTPRSIQRLVEKYAAAAGIAHQVTPQSLRHAYARQLLLEGLTIKEVQKKLGHSSVYTTSLIYG